MYVRGQVVRGRNIFTKRASFASYGGLVGVCKKPVKKWRQGLITYYYRFQKDVARTLRRPPSCYWRDTGKSYITTLSPS